MCVHTGRDFASLPMEQQLRILRDNRALVFSRAEPKHKQVRAREVIKRLQGSKAVRSK